MPSVGQEPSRPALEALPPSGGPELVVHGSDLRSALVALPGLDLERGLQAVRGALSAFVRLLRKYLEIHEGATVAFEALLAEGRTTEVRQRAHALIGAAGFLGAAQVAALALQLERAIHEEASTEEIHHRASALAREQSTFCLALRDLLDRHDPLPPQP